MRVLERRPDFGFDRVELTDFKARFLEEPVDGGRVEVPEVGRLEGEALFPEHSNHGRMYIWYAHQEITVRFKMPTELTNNTHRIFDMFEYPPK